MNKTCLYSILVFLTVLCAFQLEGGVRKGITLGTDVGLGVSVLGSNVNYKPEYWLEHGIDTTFNQIEMILRVLTLKIGYAPTNQLEFSLTGGGNFKILDLGYQGLLLSLETAYYFSPSAPSPVVRGGIGIPAVDFAFHPEDNASSGIGGYIGAGYEITKHIILGGDIVYGHADQKNTEKADRATSDFFTLLFRLEVLAY